MKNQSKIRYRTFQLRSIPCRHAVLCVDCMHEIRTNHDGRCPKGSVPEGVPGTRRCRAPRHRAPPARLRGPPLSWKVRYRTLLWFLSQMIKLYKAHSLLYRRQILQENIRWKALDEIYKIYMLLHCSDLNISEKSRQTFFRIFQHFFCKIYPFSKKNNWILLRVWWNFVGISQIFSKMLKILKFF